MFELVKQDKATLDLGDIMKVLEMTGADLKTFRGGGGGGGIFRGYQTCILQVFFRTDIIRWKSDGKVR